MNEYRMTDSIIQWLIQVVSSVIYFFKARPKIKQHVNPTDWV